MAIPPPPGPPRPPPPPAMGGLKLGGNNTTGGSDVRSALLQSIQKGTKLKKTVTVDKSAPVTTGKVVDGSDVNSISSKRVNTYRSSSSSTQPIANGGPKLAGLFEGMTSMPKLKPVSSRDNVPSSRNTTTTTSNSIAQEIKENKTIVANNSNNSSNNNNNSNINNNSMNNNNNNGPIDFNAELTKHLAQTLKRQQRQHQQSHVVNATEANLRTNRGPPPKPPVQKNMSSSTSDPVLEKSSNNTSSSSLVSGGGGKASSPTLSEGSNSSNISNNSSTTKKNPNLSLSIGHSNLNSGNSLITTNKTTMNSTTPLSHNIVPNKSRLFGTLNNSDNISSSNSNNNINSTSSKMTINNSHQNHSLSPHTPSSSSLSLQTSSSPLSLLSSSLSSSSKPVVNHGKPNCAPKPPGIQQLISNGGKPTVSRHHSMKSPRSPPITAASSGTSVFSTAQYFGTLRGPQPQFNQSQESITTVIPTSTAMRQAPNPPIGRPTEAPPKPPSLKPAPPPIPARSVSNTNLTNLPLSTVSSGSNTTNLNTSFGSTNNVSNVSAIKEQLKSQISYTGSTSNVSAIKLSTNQLSNTTTMETNLGVSNLTVGGITGKLNSPIHSSSSNSNSRGENYSQKSSNLNGMSPPVPSHRAQPAPDPPQRQILNNASLVPPKPPERHSSMRSNSAMATTAVTGIGTTNLGKIGYHSQNSSGSGNVIGGSNNNNTTTNSGIVNRLVVDIELKYRSNFHNVTEFPTPPPFLNFPKLYPSRTMNNAEIRKPRAPSPPSNRHQRGYNIDQLNEQNT